MNYVYIYVAAISLVLFFTMLADKRAAVNHRRRVPEKQLFLLALLGGATGGTLGMYAFRHKTKHWYFALGFPVIAAVQIAALIYFQFFR